MPEVNGVDTGRAYVFQETAVGNGDWQITANLQASDGAFNDRFTGVAKEGDTIVVTARLNDAAGLNAGAAYVFERTNGTWSETTKLMPSGHDAGDHFTTPAVVDGIIAVNAPNNDGLVPGAGSTHLFELIDGSWTEIDVVASSSQSPTDSSASVGWINSMTSHHLAHMASVDGIQELVVYTHDEYHNRETQLSTDTPRSLTDARGNGAEGRHVVKRSSGARLGGR